MLAGTLLVIDSGADRKFARRDVSNSLRYDKSFYGPLPNIPDFNKYRKKLR